MHHIFPQFLNQKPFPKNKLVCRMMVAQAFNVSTPEAEPDKSLVYRVPGQPELCKQKLFQKKKKDDMS